MKRFFLFLVALMLSACSFTGARPAFVGDAQRLEDRTVALVMRRDDDSLRPFCSGVWVSKTTILTAAHCVKDIGSDEDLSYLVHADVAPMVDGLRPRTAHLYARDAAHDLALLRAVEPPAHSIAQTRSADIEQGMFAEAMGHSLGLWFSFSSGQVSALRVETDDEAVQTWYVQSTAPISPGNSGGGLFDEDGRLIGIAHGYFPKGENLNLFIHRAHVDALLLLQGSGL